MPPSPFQVRKLKRDQAQKATEDMAEQLRRARCPECQNPLLWHDGPQNETARGIKCELTQEEITERLQTKQV